MANRSMLFTSSEIPCFENNTLFNLKELSEFSWDIPPAYKILISAESRIGESIIWKQQKNIFGDFEQGVRRLFQFGNFLLEMNLIEQKREFEDALVECEIYLENSINKYILLELAEILVMNDGDIVEQTKKYLKEDVLQYWTDLEYFMKNYKTNTELLNEEKYNWISSLRTNWRRELGILEWESVLCYCL